MDASWIGMQLLFIQFVFAVEIFGYTKKTYKLIDEEKTWSDARAYCLSQDGDLGVVTDFYTSKTRYLAHVLLSTPDRKAWVAGRGRDEGWNWYDRQREEAGSLSPISELTVYRGCVKPEKILGGMSMRNNNAEACFKRCQWKGDVALAKWICICERMLRNITVTANKFCDISCPGQMGDMCGGINGVSLYQMNARAVLWGDGDPQSGQECVYVNRPYEEALWSWHVSDCSMIRRYLCRYNDHHICGVHTSCVRPSTRPATWEDAVDGCDVNNGTIATVDVTHMYDADDVMTIPPGQFWVGLRKREQWTWTNGKLIPSMYFHDNRYDKCTGDTCVVLQRKGDLALAGDLCENKRPFVCEFYKEHHSPVKDPTNDQKDDPLAGVKGQGYNTTTDQTDVERREEMHRSVMFLAIGVASGMAFVFSICIIAYIARRFRQRSKWKSKGGFQRRRINNNGCFVSTSLKSTASASNAAEPEVLYDFPCDSNQSSSESPFRKTQRVLRQESLRETPYTHSRCGSDGYRSLSWKRVPSVSKKEKETKSRDRKFSIPEIRSVYSGPDTEESSFGDASYMIHQVQCHRKELPTTRNEYVDIETTSRRTRRFADLENDDAIILAETYSQPIRAETNCQSTRTGAYSQSGQAGIYSESVRAETYDHSERVRKTSDNEASIHVDTSDLYACVQKVMSTMTDERQGRLSN